MSKISIITTIYNGAEYASRYIDYFSSGVFDCESFEWIFYNDGSVDSTHSKYEKLVKFSGVKYINSAVNLGRAVALNSAIRASSYDLIAIHDVDDYFRLDRFDIQLNYFRKNEHVDILGSSALYLNSEHNYYVRKFSTNIDKIKLSFAKGVPMCNTSVCYRRSVFDALGGYPLRSDGKEDYEFWILAMERGYNFMILEDMLVIHVLHEKSYWKMKSNRFDNQAKIARLQIIAINRLSIQWYYYIYPLLRFVLALLPPFFFRGFKNFNYSRKGKNIDFRILNACFN